MPLICNAIPKSGTYLLASIAEYCGFEDTYVRFLDHGTNFVDGQNHLREYAEGNAPQRFFELPDNAYAPSHLTYDPDLADAFADGRIKHLFMYRHPGDVIWSYVRFVTYSESFATHSSDTQNTQNRMKNDFESDEQRFVHVYFQMKHNFNFVENSRWLKDTSTFTLRFEDLYTEILELREGKMGSLLDGLFEYLGHTSSEALSEMYETIHGRGPTFMPGTKKVGQYSNLDLTGISSVLNDPEFRKCLDLYGYDH